MNFRKNAIEKFIKNVIGFELVTLNAILSNVHNKHITHHHGSEIWLSRLFMKMANNGNY